MKKDLKNKIIQAYQDEVPDLKDKILSLCDDTIQTNILPSENIKTKKTVVCKKMFATICCIAIFCVGLVTGKFLIPTSTTVNEPTTCIYLDVNPSIEFSLNENNVIIDCTAGNSDGELILSGMNLKNVELQTGLNAILGSMYAKGFLNNDDNSVLISIDKLDGNNDLEYLSFITNQVNNFFSSSNMECAIIAQNVQSSEEMISRAKEQGVSVGKLHLLDKIIENMDELTHEDLSRLSSMTIKDLNAIYSQKEHSNDDLLSGNVKVNYSPNDALNCILDHLQKNFFEISSFDVKLLPSSINHTKLAYRISLIFKNDDTVYNFEVNAQTGTVDTLATTAQPNKNHDVHNPHDIHDSKP